MFTTEQDQTKNTMISYMLIRIGCGIILLFVISLLLFHMYKKFKVRKIHVKKKQVYIYDENQTMESVYQDIGDVVEIQPQQAFTTLAIEVESQILPPRSLPAKPRITMSRSTLTIQDTKCNL